jgi:hypothetical protein
MGFLPYFNLNYGRNEAHRPLDVRPDTRTNGSINICEGRINININIAYSTGIII